MSIDSSMRDAQGFVQSNGDKYKAILALIKRECNKLKDEFGDVIKSVYSRGEKQDGNELKTTEKIAIKLADLRKTYEEEKRKPRRDRKYQSVPQFHDVPDVVGLTIVVYYPDQIETTLNTLTPRLVSENFVQKEYEEKTLLGYYAFHVVYRSKKPDSNNLCCEVQCKTMLHDSWATKMHDLTYKPTGALDKRLKSLMETFGGTLQQIEIQSQSLRDMIQEQWDVEAELRRLAEEALLQGLRTWELRAHHSGRAHNLLSAIEKDGDKIKAAPLSGSMMKKYMERIDKLCDKEITEGWLLAGYLASLRVEPDLVAYLSGHVDTWLSKARELATDKNHKPSQEIRDKEREAVRAVPQIVGAAGDRALAISYYQRLIDNAAYYGLEERNCKELEFDLANLLIEQEYYKPTEDDGRRNKLDAEIEKLLHHETANDRRDIDRNAYDDAVGFKQITFGSTEKEILEGIKKCVAATPQGALATSCPYGVMYCRLHERLGWRRVFELQARDRALKVSGKQGKP